MKPSTSRRKNAFTLIELLTVIAIIGILAAILIPVVGSVRHSARSSQSLSNLRQIGLGVSLFAVEHNDTFPLLNRKLTDPDGPQFFWVQALEEVLFDWDRHVSAPPTKHPIFSDPTVELGHNISDYGANMFVFLDANAANPARSERGLTLYEIADPSRIAMVSTARDTSIGRASWYMQGAFVTGGTPPNVPDARLGSGNVGTVFVDGHVEAIEGRLIFDDLEFRRRLYDPSYQP